MITQSTKRFLACLLALVMVVSAVPMQVFAADATAPVFLVDSGEKVTGLNEAMEKTSKVAVLMNDAILPAGNYTIPAGKTLLIPYDASNTLCTDKPTVVDNYTKPSAYRTLTMASGAKITVNGALSVSGSQACGSPVTASASGPLGFVDMAEGSNITVNSGANLYAWGYITGSGTVTIKNGGTVYEDFQLSNWRGGNASVSMINNSKRVFMMSQYYIQNVEVPMTLEAGAKEFGCISVDLSDFGLQQATVPFIGPEGMFNVTEGSLVKDYIENQDRLQITMQGKAQMKNLTMKLFAYTINSKKYDLPVNGNITIRVKNGAAVAIAQNLAMLPGTEMYVEKGANIQLGNGVSLYFYDQDEWMAGDYSSSSTKFNPVKYAPGSTYTRTEADLKDACIFVEGELDASQGYVYTTNGGANITAAEGASIKLKPGTQKNTYQATQGEAISYVSIPITPAKLKNADGTYTQTASLPLGQYTYSNGTWVGVCLHVKDEKVTTAATCTSKGEKTISCACGFSETE